MMNGRDVRQDLDKPRTTDYAALRDGLVDNMLECYFLPRTTA